MECDPMQEPVSFMAGGAPPMAGPASTTPPGRPQVRNEMLEQRTCFPLQPFACCPQPVLMVCPTTCQRIHDCTHLVIVIGTFSGIALVILSASLLLLGSEECHFDDTWCLLTQFGFAPLAVIFAAPVVMYCMRIMQNYDEQLQTKQKAVREQKEGLIKCYEGLLSEMEGLLSKSSESASGLAERSFESKRRDFLRFLDRAKMRFKALQGDDEVLAQFRRFCCNWLRVFEECSIDPIGHPKRVVHREELEKCCSIEEVAEVCIERLRATEVRFISVQRDQDAQMIARKHGTLKRMTLAPNALCDAQVLALSSDASSVPPIHNVGPSRPDLVSISAAQIQERRKVWLVFGKGFGFRCQPANQSEDGYPKEIAFGCGRLFALSKQHMNLLYQFGIGCVLVGFQIAAYINASADGSVNDKDSYYSGAMLASLCLTQLCLVVLLTKFEEIDTIQQLEREVEELKIQSNAVETQREKMGEFWNNAQQLTDLWLYRTVPRLDLYKELHSQLEDIDKEDLLTNMAGANGMLEDLESNLGALEAWRSDGQLKLEEKKLFGREINQLCQEQEFDQILLKLEEVSSGPVMSKLKALPPAPRDVRVGGVVWPPANKPTVHFALAH